MERSISSIFLMNQEGHMARTVAIGIQDFEKVIKGNCFYVDKTDFIQEWWESKDEVTLITRPRRFGKTLNMSMLEQFFSIKYANRGDLFEGLSIWKQEKYHKIQGTYPVISLSFANIKEKDYEITRQKICQILTNLYAKFSFLKNSDVLTQKDRDFFDRVSIHMSDSDATMALHQLSDYMYRYYGKNRQGTEQGRNGTAADLHQGNGHEGRRKGPQRSVRTVGSLQAEPG